MAVTCCCTYQLNMILKMSGEGQLSGCPPLIAGVLLVNLSYYLVHHACISLKRYHRRSVKHALDAGGIRMFHRLLKILPGARVSHLFHAHQSLCACLCSLQSRQ